jgi:hypothetical protein
VLCLQNLGFTKTKAICRMNPKNFSNRLLDALGSSNRRHCSFYLSTALRLDEGLADEYLAGERYPDIETLYKLCDLTGRTPGYFLNAVSDDKVPSGMRVAYPIAGDETLCIQIPNKDAQLLNDLNAHWLFVDGMSNHVLRIESADKIVLYRDAQNSVPVRTGRHYVLLSPNGEMMMINCISVQSSTCIFSGLGLSHEPKLHARTILPIKQRTQTLNLQALAAMDLELLGMVVVLVRSWEDFGSHDN